MNDVNVSQESHVRSKEVMCWTFNILLSIILPRIDVDNYVSVRHLNISRKKQVSLRTSGLRLGYLPRLVLLINFLMYVYIFLLLVGPVHYNQ